MGLLPVRYNPGMEGSLHITTTVQPGGKIEIPTSTFSEGQAVEVYVVPAEQSSHQTALSIIRGLQGHRLFKNPAEVDRYLDVERDSWKAS